MTEQQSNIETDIALIKSDIKQINKFFTRVEDSLVILTELQKEVAVQKETVKFQGDKLEDVEDICSSYKKEEALRLTVLSDRLEEYRRMAREDHSRLTEKNNAIRESSNKEIIDRIDKMERGLHERITQQTKRINALENWRFYVMGIGAVILILVMRMNFPNIFG